MRIELIVQVLKLYCQWGIELLINVFFLIANPIAKFFVYLFSNNLKSLISLLVLSDTVGHLPESSEQ